MPSVTIGTKYNPDFVSHPGSTLQDMLDMHGISQSELAERTGRPKKTINEIILGKAAITPETALQLELVLKVPAQFWLQRESRYREWLAKQSESTRLASELPKLQKIPVKEMIQYQWICKHKDPFEQLREVLQYFAVTSLDAVPKFQAAAFRKTGTKDSDYWALAAWLRQGELKGNAIECEPYNPNSFLLALNEIRALTLCLPSVFVPKMKSLCARAGVAVTFVEDLPRTSVSGATRWLASSRPLIQLSLRHKTNDQVWFAFFHEAGHVLKEHAKREILIDESSYDSEDYREKEANEFACEMLIPSDELVKFCDKNDFTRQSVEKFAKRINIAPGIVVGRLQHDKLIEFSQLNALKEKYSWSDWPSGSP